MQWVSNNWADVVELHAGPDPQHRSAGTNCKRVTSEGITEYMSKPGSRLVGEMAKGIQRISREEWPGRWWGILNRKSYKRRQCIFLYRVDDPLRMSQTIQAKWRKVFPDAEWLPQWTDDPKMIQKLLNEQKVRGVTYSPGVELVEIIAGEEAFDSQVS